MPIPILTEPGLSAWTSYTPSITGSYTSATATGRFKLLGKLCFIHVKFVMIDKGPAVGLILGLPSGVVPFNDVVMLTGAERAVAGLPVQAILSAGGIAVVRIDNSYPTTFANGATIYIDGVFETI